VEVEVMDLEQETTRRKSVKRVAEAVAEAEAVVVLKVMLPLLLSSTDFQ
jgi:hypothetical protein